MVVGGFSITLETYDPSDSYLNTAVGCSTDAGATWSLLYEGSVNITSSTTANEVLFADQVCGRVRIVLRYARYTAGKWDSWAVRSAV
eukprot:scaffold290306_cov35-Tisochrysis_lutea.AAC.1